MQIYIIFLFNSNIIPSTVVGMEWGPHHENNGTIAYWPPAGYLSNVSFLLRPQCHVHVTSETNCRSCRRCVNNRTISGCLQQFWRKEFLFCVSSIGPLQKQLYFSQVIFVKTLSSLTIFLKTYWAFILLRKKKSTSYKYKSYNPNKTRQNNRNYPNT